MKRRDFVSSTTMLGIGMAAAPLSAALGKELSQQAQLQEEELITVACAISKGTTDIDYVGPCAAFETWHYDKATAKYKPKFKIFTVSETPDPVDNRIPDYTFETAPVPKIVIVPAQQGSDALLDWLKKMYVSSDLLMSVCVGARHLAKAGLLDGLQATTHHESIDKFAKEFPRVNWVKGVRFVEAGKISTGGGLTAGIDLGLRVVERYFGRESAQAVADHLEYKSRDWMVG